MHAHTQIKCMEKKVSEYSIKITKCIKRLFKCLATITENFALSLSNRLFCSVTALSLSKPGGRDAVIAFKSAAPAKPSSSLSPGSSASFRVR